MQNIMAIRVASAKVTRQNYNVKTPIWLTSRWICIGKSWGYFVVDLLSLPGKKILRLVCFYFYSYLFLHHLQIHVLTNIYTFRLPQIPVKTYYGSICIIYCSGIPFYFHRKQLRISQVAAEKPGKDHVQSVTTYKVQCS